jgi:hypothetical protein
MKSVKKFTFILPMMLILAAIPSFAQLDSSVKFEAPFSFYAGDAEMPAGSYTISQPDISESFLQLRTADGKRTVFVEYRQTDSLTTSSRTEVTFSKYGNTNFLSFITVDGQTSELQVEKSAVEKKIAHSAAAEKQSIDAKSGS